MENNSPEIDIDNMDVVDIDLFSLNDADFLVKYGVLSAIWSKLIQLKIVTIVVKNNNVALRLLTNAQDSDVILNTYLDEVRNVFTSIQKM